MGGSREVARVINAASERSLACARDDERCVCEIMSLETVLSEISRPYGEDNDEARKLRSAFRCSFLSFELRHCFVIRHSGFVIIRPPDSYDACSQASPSLALGMTECGG